MREDKKGTWFIQSVCKMVKEFSDTLDINQILTKVQEDLVDSLRSFMTTQMPIYENYLKEPFFIPTNRE